MTGVLLVAGAKVESIVQEFDVEISGTHARQRTMFAKLDRAPP